MFSECSPDLVSGLVCVMLGEGREHNESKTNVRGTIVCYRGMLVSQFPFTLVEWCLSLYSILANNESKVLFVICSPHYKTFQAETGEGEK